LVRITIFGRRPLAAAAQVQVEDQHIRGIGCDVAKRVRFRVHGADQLDIGQAVNELGEPRCEQGRVFGQQDSQ